MSLNKLSNDDKDLLLVILFLTVAPLTILSAIAGFTSYVLTPAPVLMIIGWFFGATMTFCYKKWRGLDRS